MSLDKSLKKAGSLARAQTSSPARSAWPCCRKMRSGSQAPEYTICRKPSIGGSRRVNPAQNGPRPKAEIPAHLSHGLGAVTELDRQLDSRRGVWRIIDVRAGSGTERSVFDSFGLVADVRFAWYLPSSIRGDFIYLRNQRKSRSVKPPTSWVDISIRTVRYCMITSGWWSLFFEKTRDVIHELHRTAE